jgi:hypothetical protein
MPFDAAKVAEPLDFDFSAFEDKDGKPLPKGTIPEPSKDAVQSYFKNARKEAQDAGIDATDVIDTTTEEGKVALAKVFADAEREHPGAMEKLDKAQLEGVAKLCGGTPTKEEIAALPYRQQRAFFGWLMGELSNPAASNGDMRH